MKTTCICEHRGKLCGRDTPEDVPLCEECHMALECEATGPPHVAEKAKKLLEQAGVPFGEGT